MNHYKYKLKETVLFECDAKDILEADTEFIKEVGLNPIEDSSIQCVVTYKD